jgi:tetratricopeptide (TPR) repeat protein
MKLAARFVLAGVLAAGLLTTVSCSKEAAKQQLLASGNKYFEAKKYNEAVIEYKKALQIDNLLAEAHDKLAKSYESLGDVKNAAHESILAADLMPNDPDTQVRAGLYFLAGGDFQSAKAQAQKALIKNPRHVEAQLLLAQGIAGMKDMDGAIKQMEDSIRMQPGEALPYVQLGALELAKGQADQAETAFKRAINVDPKSLPATLGLAKFYLYTGRMKDAEEWLKKTLTLAPDDVDANRALATLYLRSNRTTEAEAPLKTAARLSPAPSARLTLADYYFFTKRIRDCRQVLEGMKSDQNLDTFSQVRSRLSVLELAEGHVAEANKYVDEVLARRSTDDMASAVKGRYLIDERQFIRARDLLKASSAANPQSVALHNLLGTAYRSLGDTDAARGEFSAVQRLDAGEVHSKVQLAQLDLMEGKLDAALALATAAVSIEPRNAQARLTRIDAWTAKHDLAPALQDATLLSTLMPKSPEPATQLGRIYLLKADYAAAERWFQKAYDLSNGSADAAGALVDVKIRAGRIGEATAFAEQQLTKHPKDPSLHLDAGRAYKAAHETAKAEAAFKAALALDPDNMHAYLELSRIYIDAKRLDDARQQLEKIIAKDPKAVWAHTMVAVILHIQNRVPEARARYEQILTIDSEAGVASNNLAMLLLDEGRELDRALGLAQASKRRQPASPEVSDTLGSVYAKKGLPALAVPEFQFSVNADPANPLYLYHLGLAYLQAEDKPKARAALERALALNKPFEGRDDAQKKLASLR